MPIRAYDKLMGGKGSAQKTLDAMIARYGERKGRSVFYATVNQRKQRRGDGNRTR